MIRKTIGRTLEALGYEVRKVREQADLRPRPGPWTDLPTHTERTADIRGMVQDESCRILYAMCFLQDLRGDVAEIGSWQGKSTAFLAQAAKDSGNGTLHAIDHFQGNVNKESHYVVGSPDLSDLEQGFRDNMQRLGLTDTIKLHNKPAREAAKGIDDRSLRFLFIDGDHTLEGVTADVETYWRKLLPGAIVAFDDYATAFPGVVDVVHRLHSGLKDARAFSYRNTFVLKLPDKRLPKRPPLGA